MVKERNIFTDHQHFLYCPQCSSSVVQRISESLIVALIDQLSGFIDVTNKQLSQLHSQLITRQTRGMKTQVGLKFSHLRNFTSRLIYLRIKRVNLCLNGTKGTRNILRTTNHQNSKYPEKFNNIKEGKKSGPEIAYGQTHSYGSSAFVLSRFHCILLHYWITLS